MKHFLLSLLDKKYSIIIDVFEDKYHPYSKYVLIAVFVMLGLEALSVAL